MIYASVVTFGIIYNQFFGLHKTLAYTSITVTRNDLKYFQRFHV